MPEQPPQVLNQTAPVSCLHYGWYRASVYFFEPADYDIELTSEDSSEVWRDSVTVTGADLEPDPDALVDLELTIDRDTPVSIHDFSYDELEAGSYTFRVTRRSDGLVGAEEAVTIEAGDPVTEVNLNVNSRAAEGKMKVSVELSIPGKTIIERGVELYFINDGREEHFGHEPFQENEVIADDFHSFDLVGLPLGKYRLDYNGCLSATFTTGISLEWTETVHDDPETEGEDGRLCFRVKAKRDFEAAPVLRLGGTGPEIAFSEAEPAITDADFREQTFCFNDLKPGRYTCFVYKKHDPGVSYADMGARVGVFGVRLLEYRHDSLCPDDERGRFLFEILSNIRTRGRLYDSEGTEIPFARHVRWPGARSRYLQKVEFDGLSAGGYTFRVFPLGAGTSPDDAIHTRAEVMGTGLRAELADRAEHECNVTVSVHSDAGGVSFEYDLKKSGESVRSEARTTDADGNYELVLEDLDNGSYTLHFEEYCLEPLAFEVAAPTLAATVTTVDAFCNDGEIEITVPDEEGVIAYELVGQEFVRESEFVGLAGVRLTDMAPDAYDLTLRKVDEPCTKYRSLVDIKPPKFIINVVEQQQLRTRTGASFDPAAQYLRIEVTTDPPIARNYHAMLKKTSGGRVVEFSYVGALDGTSPDVIEFGDGTGHSIWFDFQGYFLADRPVVIFFAWCDLNPSAPCSRPDNAIETLDWNDWETTYSGAADQDCADW